MVWSTIESSLESVPTPNIVNIGVFKNSLFDVLLQVDGRLLDEGQDCCSFGTGCIIYGCTVSERNGLITIKSSERWIFIKEWECSGEGGASKYLGRPGTVSVTDTLLSSDSTCTRSSAVFPPEKIWISHSLKIQMFLSPRKTCFL